MNVSVFPTLPKFQLGQAVIHSYEADLMKDGVVPTKDFGVIVGVIYCDEDSIYVGWTYQVYLWKSIYEYGDRREIEYYSHVSYSSFNESDIVEPTLIANSQKIIDRLTRRQVRKYEAYDKGYDHKTSKLYNLVYDTLVKDNYYTNLISDLDSLDND